MPQAPLLLYGTEIHKEKRGRELILEVISEYGWASAVLDNSRSARNRRLIEAGSMLILLGWDAAPRETEFLMFFRREAPYTPVLVLGASGCNAVRAKAFEYGADNYLSPSFSKGELGAKIKRLQTLTSLGAFRHPPISIGDLQIWPDSLVVLHGGEKVRLSRLEFSMLLCLARESPQPVSRKKLEREVLGLNHQPGTNVVAVHMHRLRKKIGTGGSLLKTVPGAGYKLS
ncbi:response regulator transcription factor [Leisingera sp. D0M16]|uniref:response regulator transcription factor n=1 Tax=Leisingera coralii TaxID=3351347 RepID=UPI003B7AABB8